jgi:hypothetical protein|nr:MAG TPA: hypothetical protein [Caudoviricetes sp.]
MTSGNSRRSHALIRAQEKYAKKRVIKPVSFNAETEADLLEIVARIEDFSAWVKEKLKESK